MNLIGPVNGKTTRIDPTAFVTWGAVVLGDVELGPQINVWYGCVLRGDINWVRVGARTNLQDGTIIHVGHKGPGTLVGADVLVRHRVVLHSCVVENQALIGMGAVMLGYAKVGASSVVAPGQEMPLGVLALGISVKAKRDLASEELARPLKVVNRYLRVTQCHQDLSVSYDFSQNT